MNACYTRLALACVVSVGAACTSAPIRYYTLTPPPDERPRAEEATLAIDVRVVHIPPQLDRLELMVRTGPAETTLLENERWTSPMKDEIKNAVRLELQHRLDGMTGLPSSLTKLTIDIDVRRLEAELGRYALLEASWSAGLSGEGQPSGGTRVMTCAFRADQEIRTGYAGLVEGYQREVAALADAIASGLTSPTGNIDASCRTSSGGSGSGSD